MATNALPSAAPTPETSPGGRPRNNSSASGRAAPSVFKAIRDRLSGPAVHVDIAEWKSAAAHFRAACAATLAHDDAAFNHHMAEFRRLRADWKVVS